MVMSRIAASIGSGGSSSFRTSMTMKPINEPKLVSDKNRVELASPLSAFSTSKRMIPKAWQSLFKSPDTVWIQISRFASPGVKRITPDQAQMVLLPGIERSIRILPVEVSIIESSSLTNFSSPASGPHSSHFVVLTSSTPQGKSGSNSMCARRSASTKTRALGS